MQKTTAIPLAYLSAAGQAAIAKRATEIREALDERRAKRVIENMVLRARTSAASAPAPMPGSTAAAKVSP